VVTKAGKTFKAWKIKGPMK